MKRKLKASKNLINYKSVFVFIPRSVSENVKSELETSPDDEGLGSLSEENPQTPAACKGQTEECFKRIWTRCGGKRHFQTPPFPPLVEIHSWCSQLGWFPSCESSPVSAAAALQKARQTYAF